MKHDQGDMDIGSPVSKITTAHQNNHLRPCSAAPSWLSGTIAFMGAFCPIRFRRLSTGRSAIGFIIVVTAVSFPILAAINSPVAAEITQNEHWLRAIDLNSQMEAHPTRLPTSERERFRMLFQQIHQRHDELWSRAEGYVAQQNSLQSQISSYSSQVSQFNSSCAQVNSQSQLASCNSWKNQLESARSQLEQTNAQLTQLVNAHNSTVEQWGQDIRARFNEPLAQALSVHSRHWQFYGEGAPNAAEVDVGSDGSFTVTADNWMVTIPGCSPFALHILNGRFHDRQVTFDVTGQGCNGSTAENGHVSGTADPSFPDATSAAGSSAVTVTTPLGVTHPTLNWRARRVD